MVAVANRISPSRIAPTVDAPVEESKSAPTVDALTADQSDANAIVSAVSEIATRIRDIRARLDNSNSDATSLVGHLLSSILAIGGADVGGHDNRFDVLRQMVNEGPNSKNDPDGTSSAAQVAIAVLGYLHAGTVHPENTSAIKLIAEAWSGATNKDDGHSRVSAKMQADADAASLACIEAHRVRLAKSQSRGGVVTFDPPVKKQQTIVPDSRSNVNLASETVHRVG